jgi:hypothetical protein
MEAADGGGALAMGQRNRDVMPTEAVDKLGF